MARIPLHHLLHKGMCGPHRSLTTLQLHIPKGGVGHLLQLSPPT